MRRGAFLLRQAVQPTLQIEQLAAGLLAVERGLLQRHTDAQAHLLGVAGDVEPGDAGGAAGGAQQGGEHAHGGALAGAVGPEEAVDLAGAHREVDTGDGAVVAEHSAQCTGFDGGCHPADASVEVHWRVRSIASMRATRVRAGGWVIASRSRQLSGPVAAEVGDEPAQRHRQRPTEPHAHRAAVGLELAVATDHVGQHVAEQRAR